MRSDTTILARLLGQAEARGSDMATLRAIAEEASAAGAREALARLGLEDAGARSDIGELRDLLSAWRDARRTVRNEVVGWLVRIVLMLLVLGLVVKLGWLGVVRG